MRAVVLPGVNKPLTFVDNYPEPGIDQDGGEIIDVTACGVCRSDLHVVDGEFPSPLPLVLGHEVTAVHSELGPVMLYAPWGCGSCDMCAADEEMICANATEAGLFTDGGYCQRMWIPDRRYLAPLDGLNPITAAPLACGGLTAYRAVSHGIEILHQKRGQGRVLVIGAGGLGQFAINFLRILTDSHIIALDLSAKKQALALEFGAREVASPGDFIDPCDVILDFIGSNTTLETAASSVARKGMVIVVGLSGGSIPFGLTRVPPEAIFKTSFWGTRSQLDELLNLARREPTVIRPVEAMALADAQLAHDRLRAGQVAGRVVLIP